MDYFAGIMTLAIGLFNAYLGLLIAVRPQKAIALLRKCFPSSKQFANIDESDPRLYGKNAFYGGIAMGIFSLFIVIQGLTTLAHQTVSR